MGNDHTLNKKPEDLCAQREATDTSSKIRPLRYNIEESTIIIKIRPLRYNIEESTMIKIRPLRYNIEESTMIKLRRDLLEKRKRFQSAFSCLNIPLSQAASGKPCFFDTFATSPLDTRKISEPCSALMPPQDTFMTRVRRELLEELSKERATISCCNVLLQAASGKSSFFNTCAMPTQDTVMTRPTKQRIFRFKRMAVSTVSEENYRMIYRAGKNITVISNHFERPFSGHCGTIECTQNVVIICSSGELSRGERFEQFAIRTQKMDFTLDGYIISDLYKMYHGEKEGKGKDFTCFWEDEKTLQDKESPSDKNCESKIEILEEENKQLDKEMNEILQQCILRLNGMHTQRPAQKRQKATI